MTKTALRIMFLGALFLCGTPRSLACAGALYFPPAGKSIENQDRRTPQEVGLDPAVTQRINQYITENPYRPPRAKPRWALWRHGRLVHVEGDFHKTTDVASLRKTWHAMIVGAAIKQGKIPSLHQKISTWLPELKGNDAEATWRHVITQSAGLDYPYGDYPDYKPGQMWTYSDWNLVYLCNALARVYGKEDFYDDYADVASEAYFDAIGMEGWSTAVKKDGGFGSRSDGVRFVISLEHMGRLGLLALARGSWNGRELVPKWFVEQLESKQTSGMLVNYNGPNDGRIGLSPEKFPQCPYGYLTWVNTDRDLFEGADSAWACGRGAGGTMILWNHKNGIVFAGVTVVASSGANSVALVIESCIVGPNHLASSEGAAMVGRWDCFEASVDNATSYRDPYRDVSLNVTYESPAGQKTEFWGFYDGGTIWKIRFMPDQIGTWHYNAVFSDGSDGMRGSFRCAPSDIGGMISADETNPMWFGFKGGKHVLIRSFHVGDRFFAEDWPASKRQAFLDWAQKQGYNMLSVASHYLNRNAAGRGKGWDTPDLWDSSGSRPRAEEYRKMEAILDELSRRRIMVYPFAGFYGQASNFPTAEDDQEFFIRYTLARIGSYWNITFNVAGPDPQGRGTTLLGRLGTYIKKNDIYAHPFSIHNYQRFDFPWVSYVVLQGWKSVNLQSIYDGMQEHHANIPLYAQEVFWPGNYLHKPIVTNDHIRKKAYVLNMAAAAINYADMGSGNTLGPDYNHGNSSSGFSGSMDLDDRHQEWHDIVKAVWDFFETIPFYRMSPNQQIMDNGFCLAQEGKYYLVYLPDGGRVKLSLEPGRYKVTWINAQDTSDRRFVRTVNGGQEFCAPEGADDWLLLLTAEGAGDVEAKKD